MHRNGLIPLLQDKVSGVLFGLTSIALLSFPMTPIAEAEPTKGGTLVVAHASMPHLNPAIGSGYSIGIPGIQVFASLVRLDEDFKAHPYVAESWDITDDGLTWTFHIRDEVRFHDGQPVTSADVAYSLGVVKKTTPSAKRCSTPLRRSRHPTRKRLCSGSRTSTRRSLPPCPRS